MRKSSDLTLQLARWWGKAIRTHDPDHSLADANGDVLCSKAGARVVEINPEPSYLSHEADLVLGGHIHLPYVSDTCARAKPAAPRPMYCVQAGTALSHRVRHGSPNSINIIRWKSPAPAERRAQLARRCQRG